MSNLSEIVDSLENRVKNLIQKYDNLNQEKLKLEEELSNLKLHQHRFTDEIDQLKGECKSLKLANSMLGSQEYKRETKLKINEMVREIDKCITQLSE
jgi:peptidoglycan hydrolase CwlO-like protein